MKTFDAIIVGAGHNGLVCASYLAKSGLRVCVVEKRPFVGGAAITQEIWPGFKVSVASYWMSLLQPKIMLDLDLIEHGVEVISVPPSLHPFEDGSSIVYWGESEKFIQELAKFSAKDAANYPKFIEHMNGIIPYVRKLMFETPVDPTTGRLGNLVDCAALAWRFRDIGPKVYDLWDLITLSAHEYLSRWFESDRILTAYGSYASGAAGLISPKTPGSAYVLARPFMRDNSTKAGGGGLVKGGMGAISEALKKTALLHNVEFILGRSVSKFILSKNTATGVILEDGTELHANILISNAGAHDTYLKMIGEEKLAPQVVTAVKKHRTDSIAFKINLATNALPRWIAWDSRNLEFENPGSITVAENSNELEQAFFSARNGEISPRPYLWITTPSAYDPTISPAGMHVVQIMGGHVPYTLRGRTWDHSTRNELLDVVVKQIERYAPGFRNNIVHSQILTPSDIESMFTMRGGHVHHGEMSMDQIFFRRPIAHYADYRTPVRGLYMCGAACHPGGGVTGVPGHNAAREILKDRTVRNSIFPNAK